MNYIYLRSHLSYEHCYKVGKTENLIERENGYITGDLHRGYYEVAFEFICSNKLINVIERLIQQRFQHLKVYYDSGTEFFDKSILNEIEIYLKTLKVNFKTLTYKDIQNLQRKERLHKLTKQLEKTNLFYKLKQFIHKKNKTNKQTKIISEWIEREYQKEIIEKSKQELLENHRVYISLPTGGGKSYIVYNLLNSILNNEFIIIISPRKIVNNQNIQANYLQLLKKKYQLFDYSKDINFNTFMRQTQNKLIVCCTQSANKLYNQLMNYRLENICVWFDEAHWGVEEWISEMKDDENKEFWLCNETMISKRIYTSASPDSVIVNKNKQIFGSLISLISVKELISQNWLAPIKTFVYSENKENVNNVTYMLSDFTEQSRVFGFSFHNKQIHAFELFFHHYELYQSKQTEVKPFLLVGDNFKDERLQNIELEYNYRNIKTFEDNKYSIGFVVAQYSMGYDFNQIDYICFNDPKLSYADIIQSIGRGLRPDLLGHNGSNREKVLCISLPVYIDNFEKYDTIICVLKYLLYDIGILFEEITFMNRHNTDLSGGCIPQIDKKYNGTENIKSMLLNLLESSNQINYSQAKKIISEYHIESKKEYYELCDKELRLPKNPEEYFDIRFVGWIDYLGIERKYYDLDMCKRKVNEYLVMYPELKKHALSLSLVCNELCKKNILFPSNDLWIEYYDVSSLDDIIQYTIKKKVMTKL
jgi:superfamily II DNA or RNA helicase